MTAYTAKITTAGLALYTAAVASGTPVNLVSMAAGDGNGNPITPSVGMTALVHEVNRQALSRVLIDPEDGTIMYPEAVFGPTVGGWTIREIGLYTDTGVLFAVANFPATEKPLITDGSTRDLVIRFGLQLANPSAVTIVIDPNVVTATEAWVLAAIASNLQSAQSVATTGGTVVLTSTQYGAQFITVTGVLTSDANLVFPAQKGAWYVINNTTGAHTLTCKTASGSGVPVTQGKMDRVVGDGTNVLFASADTTTAPFGDTSNAYASTAFVQQAIGAVGGYYQDTGSVTNAYVVAPIPAPSGALQNGTSYRIRTTRTNTGATTLDDGRGAKPIKIETGGATVAGDLHGLFTVTFDATIIAGGAWVLNGEAVSELGQLAKENIGQGLEDDGSGNLRVKLADGSMRRTAAGVQTNDPVTQVSSATAINATTHGCSIVATASVNFTAAHTTTLWNGCNVAINAKGGACTLTPDAADSIDGLAAGQVYTILKGQSALFVSDGAGNWNVYFKTTPPGSVYPLYVNAAATLGAGMYDIDCSTGPVAITLTSSPAKGDTIRLRDPYGTWKGLNVPTVNPNGLTIMGLAASLVCNTQNMDFTLAYNGSDWRIS